MPIARFQMPDGRIARFEVPDGTTPEQAQSMMLSYFSQANQPSTARDNSIPSYDDVKKKPVAAEKEPSFLDKAIGAGEAGLGVLSSIPAAIPGGIAALSSILTNGKFGTQEGVKEAENRFADVANQYTYEPKTTAGKQYAENIARAIDESGIVGVPQMELARLAEAAAPAAASARSAIAARKAPIPVSAVAEQAAAPAINYDVPAFVRNPKKPVPKTEPLPVPTLPEVSAEAALADKSPLDLHMENVAANSRYGTLIPDENLQLPAASENAALKSPLDQYLERQVEPGAIEIPAASAARPELSPLDAYIAEQNGPLFKGEIPQASAAKLSPLEEYMLSGKADRDISPERFDLFLRENNAAPAIEKSPLDKYLSGEKLATDEANQVAQADLQAAPALEKTSPKAVAAKVEEVAPVESIVEAAPKEPNPILDRPLSIMAKRAGDVLSDGEKAERANVLQRIGMNQARQSAISGNSLEGAIQAQMSKFLEHPAGVAAKEMFDTERKTLQNYAQRIVNQTGGSLGMDEAAQNARGQVVATPFDGLRKYFDQAIDNLYKQADERSGGMPSTELNGLHDLLGTQSAFAGKSENGALRRGLKAYMREQGIMDKDGSLSAVTPQQAEGIKQYLNGQWSPSTSGLIGKIKDVIDNDVFSSAGEDIYAQARQMYSSKKATLDDPSGISKLFEYDPKTPINRTTPFEKIPDTITRLPTAQFGHVLDVLKKIVDPAYQTPEQLVNQAREAVNEIKAHMLNKLLDIGSQYKGQWNSNGVTQYIKSNTSKFRMLFSDQELSQILDLNDAGHILAVDASYPGAAAQTQIAMKRGLLPNFIGKGMAGLGGLAGSFGGPMGATAGAAIGSAAGEKLASTMAGNSALKHFNSGIVDLSNTSAPTMSAVEKLKNSTAASILRDAVQAVEESGIVSSAQVPALAPYVAPAEVGIINAGRNR
jgi:hypothetical protein